MVVVADLVDWMTHYYPSWATYCVLMEYHLVVMDKRAGVRPMKIGETL